MKNIICYGDSNTFGFNPVDNSRFDENTRWTALLQKKLGDEYKVINEGMCDRTGFVNNPKGFLFSAPRHFHKIMGVNSPDIIVLSVGTNDLQSQYDISFGQVERGLEDLIKVAQEKTKNIILIPPVVLEENVLDGCFSFQFNNESVIKSRKVGKIYKKLAGVYGCKIFDINDFTKPCDFDGLHYDEKAHRLIADNLYEFIQKADFYATIN